MFHCFNDIPIPCAAPTTFDFNITQGSILKILCKLGLLDGGPNGGISNDKDMHLMYFHSDGHCVNISGVGNYKINDRHLVTFCAVIEADLNGKICLVLGIFHNNAYVYGNLVCDQPVGAGGQSCVATPDRYTIPVCFCTSLPYIK